MTTANLPPEPKDRKDAAAVQEKAGRGGGASASGSPSPPGTPSQAPASSSQPQAPSSSSSSSPPSTKANTNKKTAPVFASFDQWLQENSFNTVELLYNRSYKPQLMEKGRQLKLPPAVTLKHQPYRHVDHLEFMNVEELKSFVNYWTNQCEMLKQRGGWMYGYYLEDQHYKLGIRAVLEGIYEPPQICVGEIPELPDEDPFLPCVDRIAAAMGLERIGWCFTHLPRRELLTSSEAQRAARYQLAFLSDKHYTGYPVSKFTTMTISPDPEAGAVPNTFMISDLGVAFVRDGVLGESPDSQHLQLRPKKEFEVYPQVLEGGRDTTRFDVDWLIVRVNESAPKKPRSLFKFATFARENREYETQTPAAVKAAISSRKALPSYDRFSDFHLLLYLASLLGEDTAMTIAKAIRYQEEIESNLIDTLCNMA